MRTLKEIQDEETVGEIMTVEEFAERLEDGYIGDFDGDGYYHDGKRRITKPFLSLDPDEVRNSGFPYVLWFNR